MLHTKLKYTCNSAKGDDNLYPSRSLSVFPSITSKHKYFGGGYDYTCVNGIIDSDWTKEAAASEDNQRDMILNAEFSNDSGEFL